jgi:hypothetical protein
MVKSDGVSVFAAYGDEVVVWDAVSGVVRSRTAIPLSQEVEGNVDCYSSIQNLLLFESRLVAITTGYCYEIYGPYYDDAVDDANEDVDDVRILSNYGSQGGTRVFVFDTSSDDDVLPVVAKTSLQGYYLSARSIESNVHVVTTSYVDSYSVLTQHLSRYNGKEYSSLLENQYRSAAHDRAASAIPAFGKIERWRFCTAASLCTHSICYFFLNWSSHPSFSLLISFHYFRSLKSTAFLRNSRKMQDVRVMLVYQCSRIQGNSWASLVGGRSSPP